MLERRHIPVLDLTRPFLKSIGEDGQLVHSHRDGHLNPHGHEVTAQALLEFLRETKALPKA